jgi:hypothetical protein
MPPLNQALQVEPERIKPGQRDDAEGDRLMSSHRARLHASD